MAWIGTGRDAPRPERERGVRAPQSRNDPRNAGCAIAGAGRFRIAPVNRSAELTERLAQVPPGTHDRFAAAIERIGRCDLPYIMPRQMEAAIEEKFNELRAVPELRRYHDFSKDWFGEPTIEAIALLGRWNKTCDQGIIPDATRSRERVKQLSKAQGIALPGSVRVSELGGLQWAIGFLIETLRREKD